MAREAPATPGAPAERSARRTGIDLLPEELTCPLTFELMVDPVVTADGQTYERAAIAQWLAAHDTSPLTGEVLAHKALTPNVMARSLCRRLLEADPQLGRG